MKKLENTKPFSIQGYKAMRVQRSKINVSSVDSLNTKIQTCWENFRTLRPPTPTISDFKTSLSIPDIDLDQDWQPIEKVITEIKEELRASDEI